MRTLYVLLILVLLTTSAFSAEAVFGVDQAIVITPSPEITPNYGAVVAISFSIPDSLDSITVIYAELIVPLNFSNVTIGSDSVLKISGNPIKHEWNVSSVWGNPWVSPGDDLDTLHNFGYTLTMGDNERQTVYLDITPNIMEIVSGRKPNYGILLMPQSYSESAHLLPQVLANQIREKGTIRIIYQ